MPIEQVVCNGKRIVDKHTHYELYVHLGSTPATIMIRGDVAADFRQAYKKPIFESTFIADLDFRRNDSRVKECQDLFQPPSRPYAYLAIEDIVSVQ